MKTVERAQDENQTPAFFEISDVNVKGAPSKRMLCILTTNGCEKANLENFYLMYDFNPRASGVVDKNDLMRQAEKIFQHPEINNIKELHVSLTGSFFDNEEMPKSVRNYILRSCASVPNLSKISVETRMEYVSAKKLAEAKKLIRQEQELEIAVGYETRNAAIRNDIFEKQFTEEEFNKCLKICRKKEVSLKAFIPIKPPPLSEKEAEREAAITAIHIFKKCGQYNIPAKISLQPLFIAGDSLEKMYSENKFSPPNLWTVINVIKHAHAARDAYKYNGLIHCAVNSEGLGKVAADSCSECKERIITAIDKYNAVQDITEIKQLSCKCRINIELKQFQAIKNLEINASTNSGEIMTDEEYGILLDVTAFFEQFLSRNMKREYDYQTYHIDMPYYLSKLENIKNKLSKKFISVLKSTLGANLQRIKKECLILFVKALMQERQFQNNKIYSAPVDIA